MIYINLSINMPFMKHKFKVLWHNAWPITTNKTLECQIDHTNDLLTAHFAWTTKQDHAGLTLELALLTLHCYITFVDNRHWDIENDTWEVYK